jgi:hypothetical protein
MSKKWPERRPDKVAGMELFRALKATVRSSGFILSAQGNQGKVLSRKVT